MKDILIKNAEIITMNDEMEIVYGDILIQDGCIAALGKDIQASDPGQTRIIDGTGKTVLPGLSKRIFIYARRFFGARPTIWN